MGFHKGVNVFIDDKNLTRQDQEKKKTLEAVVKDC